MTISTVREKLYYYIRVADDKKLKAIYTMLEHEIVQEMEWWEDKEFTKELDKRVKDWSSGKQKGYKLSDVQDSISQLQTKRLKK